MSTLALFAVLYLVCGLLVAATLVGVSRWLKYPRRGMGRALVLAGLWLLLALMTFPLAMLLADNPSVAVLSWVALAAGVALEVLSLWWIYRPTIGKALGGWGLTLVSRLLYTLFLLVVVRGFLVEAYRAPTLSMAPTILSAHATTRCPNCGGTVYFELESPQPQFTRLPSHDITGLCLDCLKETTADRTKLSATGADRFMVAKFLTPRRWDIIAIHHLGDIYVKRLIGLPGDEVAIQPDGHLVLNGKPAASPSGVPAKFPWLVLPAGVPPDALHFTLTPGMSLKLAGDDYFVIGDNSARSNDSRLFGPVHKSDIVGVMTVIYWPPSRFCIFR